MSDRKISELTSLTAADIAAGDLFHVVNISEQAADKNQSMTRNELIELINPAIDSYTPTILGLGTVTLIQYSYINRNGLMTIWGEHKSGSPTPAEIQIPIPTGFKIHTGFVRPVSLGRFQRDGINTARYHVIATAGDLFLNIGRLDTGTGVYVAMLGDAGMGTNEKASFTVTFPVEAV